MFAFFFNYCFLNFARCLSHDKQDVHLSHRLVTLTATDRCYILNSNFGLLCESPLFVPSVHRNLLLTNFEGLNCRGHVLFTTVARHQQRVICTYWQLFAVSCILHKNSVFFLDLPVFKTQKTCFSKRLQRGLTTVCTSTMCVIEAELIMCVICWGNKGMLRCWV